MSNLENISEADLGLMQIEILLDAGVCICSSDIIPDVY